MIVAQMARLALPKKTADSLISTFVADTPPQQAAMFKFRQNIGPVQDSAAAGASADMHLTKN
jgi:hypothetical protein